MLLICYGILAFIVTFIILGSDIKRKLLKILPALMTFIIAICCISAFFVLISNRHDEVKTKTISIVSFKVYGYEEERRVIAGNGFSGLTAYTVTDQKDEYVYYYKNNDGAYKKGSIPCNNAVVFEENECKNPSIIVKKTIVRSDYNIDDFYQKFMFFSNVLNYTKETKYEIHIPKGTFIVN